MYLPDFNTSNGATVHFKRLSNTSLDMQQNAEDDFLGHGT